MFEVILLIGTIFILLYILGIFIKDNSIIDIFWGVGFVIIGVYTFVFESNQNIDQIILTSLIFIWGFRLGTHIYYKKSKGEDFRYHNFRKNRKYFHIRSFFQIFMLQFCLMLIISTPIFIVNVYGNNYENVNILVFIGAVIAFFGFIRESIADYQLMQFKKNKKKNEIMDKKLFRYSRHPNYYGESVFWFGVGVIGTGINPVSFISFGIITFLLLYISGVPMIEKHFENNPEYQKYKERTNKFFPMPP